ncbi:DeoR family transcriptional regulator, partial [Streptomyces sp. ZEA17I]
RRTTAGRNGGLGPQLRSASALSSDQPSTGERARVADLRRR